MDRPHLTDALAPLAQTEGGFAMVALDQRESLRGMLADPGNPGGVPDRALRTFKQVGSAVLSGDASAILLDRPFGLEGERPSHLAQGCALIVAADVLIQEAGHPVRDTDLDPEVTPEYVKAVEADALKLLVLWRDGANHGQSVELVDRFLAVCRSAAVPGIVEGIVRPAPGTRRWASAEHRDEAVLSAAQVLSARGADLYKAEVPGYRPGDVSDVRRWSARLASVVRCPWVVLSNGVQGEDFPECVEEACAGGAAGFLAGRAIWADTLGASDPAAAMQAYSVPRLRHLRTVVARWNSDPAAS